MLGGYRIPGVSKIFLSSQTIYLDHVKALAALQILLAILIVNPEHRYEARLLMLYNSMCPLFKITDILRDIHLILSQCKLDIFNNVSRLVKRNIELLYKPTAEMRSDPKLLETINSPRDTQMKSAVRAALFDIPLERMKSKLSRELCEQYIDGLRHFLPGISVPLLGKEAAERFKRQLFSDL